MTANKKVDHLCVFTYTHMTICYNDVTVASFINIKYGDVAVEVVLSRNEQHAVICSFCGQ